MDNATKEKLAACAVEAKKKAIGLWNVCKAKTVSTWQSGRKGKAICIGVAAVVLVLMMQCGGGGSSGGNDGGSGGEYTGKNFSTVFVGNPTPDEGVIYTHSPDTSIKVLQATRGGNLVGYVQGANPFTSGLESAFGSLGVSFDRTVWVETPGKVYEDGERLGAGYYIRRGSYEYEGVDGGEHTVARYVEVTDEATLKKIQKQIDEEKAAEAKAKLEAEGQPIEVNAPVKSLCGFAIGATPSSLTDLFKQARWNADRTEMSGELATPFRLFDTAELTFSTNHPSGGKHLCRMKLKPASGRSPLQSIQENLEEIANVVAMMEKKFGIKFETRDGEYYTWNTTGGDESIRQSITLSFTPSGRFLYMVFDSELISRKERNALAEQQKPAKLSADAGADQL